MFQKYTFEDFDWANVSHLKLQMPVIWSFWLYRYIFNPKESYFLGMDHLS